jgi:uncharacterized lipoprotein YmbA
MYGIKWMMMAFTLAGCASAGRVAQEETYVCQDGRTLTASVTRVQAVVRVDGRVFNLDGAERREREWSTTVHYSDGVRTDFYTDGRSARLATSAGNYDQCVRT